MAKPYKFKSMKTYKSWLRGGHAKKAFIDKGSPNTVLIKKSPHKLQRGIHLPKKRGK